MKRLLIAVLSSALLVGCGGSGGSSTGGGSTGGGSTGGGSTGDGSTGSGSTGDGSTGGGSSTAFDVDGLFLNSTGTMSLIVDTKSGFVNVFKSDSGETLYNVNTVTYKNGNVVSLTGVTAITFSEWLSVPDEKGTLTYSDDGKTATFNFDYNFVADGVTHEGTLAETFARQPDSKMLAELVGSNTSTIDSGAEWIVSADGSVSANAFCTFSGSLTPVKFYYTLDLTATGCSEDHSAYENATLKGLAYTAEYNGQSRLIAFAVDSTKSAVVWDIVELK